MVLYFSATGNTRFIAEELAAGLGDERLNLLKRIRGIKERNAYLLAGVCSVSCRLLYELCRKLDLNG